MEPEHARQLLSRERTRIEEGLRAMGVDPILEGDTHLEPGDRDGEEMYLDELGQARLEQLQGELAALKRAEARLEAGTYGTSVDSGEPIPDGRLEALPLAERTVEEDERFRHGQ